jgi:hypothetical protein
LLKSRTESNESLATLERFGLGRRGNDVDEGLAFTTGEGTRDVLSLSQLSGDGLPVDLAEDVGSRHNTYHD